jgi:hypothetical protein
MADRFTVLVEVECTSEGSLIATVCSADADVRLRADPVRLTVSVWSDGGDIVRVAVQHRASRTLAYLQGNRAIRDLCERLRVSVTPAPVPGDGT